MYFQGFEKRKKTGTFVLCLIPFLLMEKYISEEIALFIGAGAIRAGAPAAAAVAGLGAAYALFPPPFCLVYIASRKAKYGGDDEYYYKVCHADAPDRAYSALRSLSAFLMK